VRTNVHTNGIGDCFEWDSVKATANFRKHGVHFVEAASALQDHDALTRIDPEPAGKERITIRIDKDVLDWFRSTIESAGGGSYQGLINDALRAYIQSKDSAFEELLRRVIRDELKRSK